MKQGQIYNDDLFYVTLFFSLENGANLRLFFTLQNFQIVEGRGAATHVIGR